MRHPGGRSPRPFALEMERLEERRLLAGSPPTIPPGIAHAAVANPSVSYAVADVKVLENQGAAEVTVVRSGDIDVVVSSLFYETHDQSATALADYKPTAQILGFGPGESIKTFKVPVIDDAVSEGDERFTIRFFSIRETSNGVETIDRATTTVTIVDDEPPTSRPSTPRPVSIVAARLAMKKKTVTGIVIQVDGGLDSSSARALSNHVLISAGRDKIFGTRDDKVVRLSKAAYNPATNTITITARGGSLALGSPLRLTVNGSSSGLLDLSGRPIDGNRDGVAGGDFVAMVTRKAVTPLGDGLASRTP
ncbi:Calx-beta domain-containing protein [Aquisphaera insulae]|uniref:Calx-beta domain-containing protein n=1 Tax=Aquisphaera insulae TaxID=2712864 RepID=UPI0013E9D126|nr:Calx-beta domain-containing protein [Aquisphaera insulae]